MLQRSKSEGNMSRASRPPVRSDMRVRIRVGPNRVISLNVNPLRDVQCLKRLLVEHQYGIQSEDDNDDDVGSLQPANEDHVPWYNATVLPLTRALSAADDGRRLPRLFLQGHEIPNRQLCADIPTCPDNEQV